MFDVQYEQKGAKVVAIVGSEDKRGVSMEWGVTGEHRVLAPTIVYGGKTRACEPKESDVPEGWHVTNTSNHWCSTKTKMSRLKKIVLPYYRAERKRHGLKKDHPGIYLMDAWRGQWRRKVLRLLRKNHVLPVKVPEGYTDKLAPMDASGGPNSILKKTYKDCYVEDYAAHVATDGARPYDMRLTSLKPKMIEWLQKGFDSIKPVHIAAAFKQTRVNTFLAGGDVYPPGALIPIAGARL